MKKENVTQFLIAKGKYFPNNKLHEIGRKLELIEGLDYAIHISYNSTVKGIIFTMLFAPFDRLILKDYFLGTIKLLFAMFAIYSLFSNGNHLRGIPYPFESGYELNPESLKYLLFLILIIWQFLDIITVYWRVKKTNYKKLMYIIKSSYQFTSNKENVFSKTTNLEEKNSEIEDWLKNNPNCSLNDYYIKKSR